MPSIKMRNDDGKLVEVYVSPVGRRATTVKRDFWYYPGNWGAYPYDEFAISALKEYRAGCAKTVGEMAAIQKAIVGPDAREIKEARKDFTRQEKAATMVLNYIDCDVGDNQINAWPIELSHELDMVFFRYENARNTNAIRTARISRHLAPKQLTR